MIDPLPLQNFQYGGKNSLISSREMLPENNKKKLQSDYINFSRYVIRLQCIQ